MDDLQSDYKTYPNFCKEMEETIGYLQTDFYNNIDLTMIEILSNWVRDRNQLKKLSQLHQFVHF